jgi:hypothetical protein
MFCLLFRHECYNFRFSLFDVSMEKSKLLLILLPLLLKNRTNSIIEHYLMYHYGDSHQEEENTVSGSIFTHLKVVRDSIPRPLQAGHRITEDWLLSLPSSECKWRFW